MTLIPGVPAPFALLKVLPLPTSTVDVSDVSCEHVKNDGKLPAASSGLGCTCVVKRRAVADRRADRAGIDRDGRRLRVLCCRRAWSSATVRLVWAKLKSPAASPLFVTTTWSSIVGSRRRGCCSCHRGVPGGIELEVHAPACCRPPGSTGRECSDEVYRLAGVQGTEAAVQRRRGRADAGADRLGARRVSLIVQLAPATVGRRGGRGSATAARCCSCRHSGAIRRSRPGCRRRHADDEAPEAGCGAVDELSVPWPTIQFGLAARAVPPPRTESANTEAVTIAPAMPRVRRFGGVVVARIDSPLDPPNGPRDG